MEQVYGALNELQIYETCPLNFFSTLGLAWQAWLKKTEVDTELLTDAHMLLMVGRSIRGGILHTLHHYGKANKST